tara:strand:- start:1476 stop:1649 length:174 start_codon:yes stop_codon:yes gene_type:complete
MDPNRKTEPEEILEKARQWLSEFFEDVDMDPEKMGKTGWSETPDPEAACDLPGRRVR